MGQTLRLHRFGGTCTHWFDGTCRDVTLLRRLASTFYGDRNRIDVPQFPLESK